MKVKRSAKGLKKIGLEDMYRLNRLSEEIDGRVHKRLPYFIEQVYNRKRLHASLDYVPPLKTRQC